MKTMLTILNDIRTEAIKAHENQKVFLHLLEDLANKDLVAFLIKKLKVKRHAINSWVNLKKIPKSRIEEINHYVAEFKLEGN